jgi:hypothetical protein
MLQVMRSIADRMDGSWSFGQIFSSLSECARYRLVIGFTIFRATKDTIYMLGRYQ